jgi:hypothetical protein
MELKPAKCPGCGAALQAPTDRDRFYCSFCGQLVLLDRGPGTAAEPPIQNWMRLAQGAENGKNFEEAYKYYIQVLEHEPKNSKAWLGKARAAGWGSTLVQVRLPEVTVAAQNAVTYSDDSTVTSIEASKLIQSVAWTIYTMSSKQLSQSENVHGTFDAHAVRCIAILDALDVAQELNHADKTHLEVAARVCDDLTTAVQRFYRRMAGNAVGGIFDALLDMPRTHAAQLEDSKLPKTFWDAFAKRRGAYAEKLKQLRVSAEVHTATASRSYKPGQLARCPSCHTWLPTNASRCFSCNRSF